MVLYRKIGFKISHIPSRNGDTDVVMWMPLREMGRNLEQMLVDREGRGIDG